MLDYTLFFHNIRENVRVRGDAWMERRGLQGKESPPVAKM